MKLNMICIKFHKKNEKPKYLNFVLLGFKVFI